MSDVIIRNVQLSDLDRCYEIESDAYEGDEAATREKIQTRINAWPDGFIVIEHEGQVAGFINSGATFDVQMSDEAFKEMIGHDPAGPKVVIMSVVVHPDFQGQGLSARLMTEFVERMKQLGKTEIHLMCRTQHVPLYERFGYEYIKPSDSTHGGMAWHEMIRHL